MLIAKLLFDELRPDHHQRVVKLLNHLSYIEDLPASFLSSVSQDLMAESWNHCYRCVGIYNDEIICYGVALFELKARGGRCCHIEDIVVDPSYQRLGVGRQLIKHLVQIAESFSCYKVQLVTGPNTIPFYESCGFAVNGVEMRLLNSKYNSTQLAQPLSA